MLMSSSQLIEKRAYIILTVYFSYLLKMGLPLFPNPLSEASNCTQPQTALV